MTMSAGWYLRRLSRMGPREVGGRAADAVRRRRWRSARPLCPAVTGARFTAVLPAGAVAAVAPDAAKRLVAEADRLLAGHVEYFGVLRDDLADPDWWYDPKTGRRAPWGYAFDVPYRDEEAVGDIKQIWELSRHQYLTVLAAAYAVTGDERYAERVAEHLRSWWASNAPLRGVHWTSGIELGIRLLSWVWIRRLLDGWPGAAALFEGNPVALDQIWQHQRWLAAFPSRGSSANNHAVAEAAGQFAAACAFRWFPASARWRADALRSLERHLRSNTFGSGLNRELATEYHGLVLELGLAALAEADAARVPVPATVRLVLLRMTDALAAVVDDRLRPPRQGDADDGHGLVVDGAGTDRWASLLATGGAVFGPLDWWPAVTGTDVRTPLLTALVRPYGKEGAAPAVSRPARRPAHFADAGLTVLRGPAGIWCRCDGGPHGFLSIAAHAHADALSVEVRHDGVDVLADPGTFCYHGQPVWRRYFRSTLGHNTLELDGTDQSVSGGPFLWTRHARSRVLAVQTPQEGVSRWCAEHDGYGRTVHRRRVELTHASRELRVVDEVRGEGRAVRLAFHLGPAVAADLAGSRAVLTWVRDGEERSALLDLPSRLSWRAHRGESDPPLGWYSPGFGRREPATTLVGTGFTDGTERFTTVLAFDDQ
ncbi:alginate lyase family protein [Streptomyces olivaceus]|uniref:Heparinase II/III family protein n=2 Tax=Streptomyces olivaceus TaxID=47716 RepID=A0ABS7W0V3_STROV|nr:alginate lyase family protein [Streptomyces olivaceus]MBZ6088026.1 heparinase II/III family protein [Streptomyces olivaceus]MBZ6095138.1 heparinase II/III family protein [Streptomyces olivaceus]MBZ6116165.1 heparinase II/III family protein [Streptomyces olivaceus]MBZ6150870.1 heparinase II/III family protein [Streptomyces olivaceus]MBZ6297544.1 heparinase II/III family protein [Streptomyces olivaceus]